MRSYRAIAIGIAVALAAACGDDGGSSTTRHTLTVSKTGTGTGTVTSAPAGIDCGPSCSAKFEEGATVTLSAAGLAGSTFTGWSGGCDGTAATCTVDVDANVSVTAGFAAAPSVRTLRVFAWGGGHVNLATPGVYEYADGATVTLTATADDGKVFVGWSGAATGTAETQVITMNEDKLVGARFWSGAPCASDLPPAGEGGVPAPTGTAGNLQVLDWAGFSSAISYTFDDARVSQAYGTNYATLTAPGIPMTFYVSPREAAKNLEFWQGVAEDGNEIGNHTEDHCMVYEDGTLVLNPDPSKNEQGCAYRYGVSETTQTAMDEIDAANEYIQSEIGQDGVFTFASPNGDGDWAPFAAAAGMLMHRNVWSTYNSDDPFVPALDLAKQYSVPGVWFGPVIEPGQSGTWGELGDTADVINGVIDDVREANGWSTFLFHRVTPAPEDESDGCCAVPAAEIADSMEHLNALGDVWGGTAVDVAAYWIGQKLLSDATPTTQDGVTTWTWTLPPNFPPGKHVRVTVDGGTLSQGGQELAWDEHGYYEVALDAGELTLAGAEEPPPTPSALKIVGTTGHNAAANEHGLTVHFTIPAIDLTVGAWTVSYEYYRPEATPDTKDTTKQIQFGLGESPWTAVYFNKYDGWSNNWRTMSYDLSADAPAYGTKFAGAKSFNIALPNDTDGTAVTWYLRNLVITNGTTSISLEVTTATDPSIATITTGTGDVTIGMP